MSVGTTAAVRAVDDLVREVRRRCRPDGAAAKAARSRQDRLVKPPGALGVLEDVSVQLAGLSGRCPPPVPERATLTVFAADHGVHVQGVSPWPQAVTAQMIGAFLAGRAAVNALAATVGAEVVVVDVGVATPVTVPPGSTAFRDRRVRAGTADLATGAAMTRDEAAQALLAGAAVADDLVAGGAQILLTGDMGIANTTASAALVAAFTGAPATRVTGRGTGIDDSTLRHKTEVVQTALVLHADVVAAATTDPLGAAAALGGLEHAAIAGLVLAAARHRVPVILDGVIAGAAALVAVTLAPQVADVCIAGHRSVEPGHTVALRSLGLRPLVDLDLRLGEGTGALLALPVVRAAARALREMATLEEIGAVQDLPDDVAPEIGPGGDQ